MAQDDKLTVFSVGNGDTILLQAAGKRVLTDINYCDNNHDDDAPPDVADAIRDACDDGHLHVFVLTHPDQDHLGGFEKVFHTGAPGDRDDKPSEGDAKILIDEIWCSPYAVDPNYTTDASKPVVDEIQRRNKLRGDAAQRDGNRLKVLDTSKTREGTVTENLAWRLLAPTPEEADIPEGEDEDDRPSSNSSSLVIKWMISVDGTESDVILGGDSTFEVWERLDAQESDDDLGWHILVAPHHCSRHAMGARDVETDEFVWSDAAKRALSHQQDDGWVVASSKEIKRNDDNPPSWEAKQRYLKMLAGDSEVDDDAKSRFLCTGTFDDGKRGHISFGFNASGAYRKGGPDKPKKRRSAVAAGGSYG